LGQASSHGFSGKGVEGLANDGAEGVGVHGQANAALGVGVWAESDKGIAVNAVSSGTGTAVQGQSTSGVGGVFAAGPAVIQPSDAPPGRAGVFRADGAAQVRFVPHLAPNNPTSNQPFAAQALIAKGQEAAFPANGKPGDLLSAMMLVREPQGTVEVATLWFCETGGVDKTHPAHWRQVLLGPVLYGHG
jgi:hypothetical protein